MTREKADHSLIGMTTRRIRGRAGVEANARLTAMTGIVLLVLFIAEIATVLMGARSVLTLHVMPRARHGAQRERRRDPRGTDQRPRLTLGLCCLIRQRQRA